MSNDPARPFGDDGAVIYLPEGGRLEGRRVLIERAVLTMWGALCSIDPAEQSPFKDKEQAYAWCREQAEFLADHIIADREKQG